MPVVQPKSIDVNYFSPQTEKLFLPLTATFSENSIIYHEKTNQKDVKTMNMNKRMSMNLKNYLSATILTAQSMTGMLAQESSPTAKESLPLMPVQISVVYPMTTMGDQTVNYRYSLSFNLFSGKVGAVKGVEFGTIFNHVEQNVLGVQFGGIVNRTREITGIQFGGISNTSTTVKGIQFGGLLNVSEGVSGIQFGGISNFSDSIRGLQFGGIINHSKEVNGIQCAGIVNVAENVKGMQFAGITNLSEKSDGVQIAGIANISREVSGVSIGGIFNRTGTLRGIQIGGIVNVIDSLESGISISLVNIVKKGAYKEWSLAFADYMNVGLSYKFGIQKFYILFTAGANFLENNLWISGIGFGHRSSLGSRFDFQPEIVSYQYYPWNFKNVYHLTSNHLKIGFIYKLNDRLGISIAPSLYLLNGDARRTERVGSIPPFAEWKKNYSYQNRYFEIDDVIRYSFGAGISVGLLLN